MIIDVVASSLDDSSSENCNRSQSFTACSQCFKILIYTQLIYQYLLQIQENLLRGSGSPAHQQPPLPTSAGDFWLESDGGGTRGRPANK